MDIFWKKLKCNSKILHKSLYVAKQCHNKKDYVKSVDVHGQKE